MLPEFNSLLASPWMWFFDCYCSQIVHKSALRIYNVFRANETVNLCKVSSSTLNLHVFNKKISNSQFHII